MKMIGHSNVLLLKSAQFREEGSFTDVQLKIGDTAFSAHRMVLAAYSNYFFAMFTNGMKESTQEVIELKDESISSDVLKIVMDSIYTGDLLVNEENVFEVLAAADHLQVTSVVQQCCHYLTEFVELRFDVETFCRIWTTADKHGLKDLQEAAEHKMASMYENVCESEEFLSYINAEQFRSILGRDDLSAPSETFVFNSVMQWIKHKKEERMADAAKVIGAVRLGLVDIEAMIEELNTDEMQQVPEIRMHLHESLIHKCRPSNSSKFAEEKTKPRQLARSVSPELLITDEEVEQEVVLSKKAAATQRSWKLKGKKARERQPLKKQPQTPKLEPLGTQAPGLPVRGIRPFWNLPSPALVSDLEPELPQCPVCNALLPRNINRDEHVNGHFE